jgi:hypothetical protein
MLWPEPVSDQRCDEMASGSTPGLLLMPIRWAISSSWAVGSQMCWRTEDQSKVVAAIVASEAGQPEEIAGDSH